MFMLFWGTVLVEGLVHILGRWPSVRSVIACLVAGALGFGAALSLATNHNAFSAVFVVISMYRILNMVRIVKRRMHEGYLQSATRRTTLVLAGLQLVVIVSWWAWNNWHTTGHGVWAVAALAQSIIALLLLLATIRNLRHTSWPVGRSQYSDKELPTVTVAIPARNETEDLQLCLESVIASNYPKLEIIVLDDCSQTRRTPEIIRSFAQDGVRFIQGQEPSESWLPKNQAYQRLASEASGEYILFCGVDVRLASGSIRSLISTMLDRNKAMICILPNRRREAYGRLSLIQAARYWWELALPRRQLNRPPVLSTCWAIQSAALKKLGGFAAISRSIVPEAYFARNLVGDDKYSFFRTVDGLGIESNKRVQDQRDTAVRMRYPQMHRRPEQVALTSLLEVFLLLAPLLLAILGFWVSIGSVAHIAAATASVLVGVSYICVALATRANSWWFAIVAQPLAVLTDIILLHYSMWKYEFTSVDWKGRNVSFPVMHVVPSLPRMENE